MTQTRMQIWLKQIDGDNSATFYQGYAGTMFKDAPLLTVQ